MKIGIIATHSFPIPYPNLHTGDIIILNLAKSLQKLGQEVTLYAPEGTQFDNLKSIKPSLGKADPTAYKCENEIYLTYKDSLFSQDIISDFSSTKHISKAMNNEGFAATCCTLMGGPWRYTWETNNIITWSQSHQFRVLNGLTDYHQTPYVTMDNGGYPVSQAAVIYGGIDTDFYVPSYKKDNYFLWLGRWHEARGYRIAIEIAKRTGIRLILAGEHPDNEFFETQKKSAQEAEQLCQGHSNIEIVWLPPDPDHHLMKRKLYQEAIAFINPTQFHEPFGMSQVEAMACGTPVITTNYGSMPEIITHKKTGIVCQNDIYELSQACYQINNIDYYTCRQRAEEFDQKVMAQSYLNFYQNILTQS